MTSYVANPAVAVATAQQVVAYAPTSAVSNDEVGAMLEKLVTEVEIVLTAMGPATPPSQHAALHSLLESIILTRRSRDTGTAMTLLKKVRCMSQILYLHKQIMYLKRKVNRLLFFSGCRRIVRSYNI